MKRTDEAMITGDWVLVAGGCRSHLAAYGGTERGIASFHGGDPKQMSHQKVILVLFFLVVGDISIIIMYIHS